MKNENLKELKILPYISNFVLFLLFLSVVSTILVPYFNYFNYSKESFITGVLSRILFFIIILYIYFQLKALIKNKLNKQQILERLINSFRVVGLLLIALDVTTICVWLVVSIKDLSKLLLVFSNLVWFRSILGLLLITFAEMLLISLRIKQENDLTV